MGGTNHRWRPEQAAEIGGGDVKRICQGLRDRDIAGIASLIISRCPSAERHWPIGQNRSERHRLTQRRQCWVDSRQIDNRFKSGPGLTLGARDPIELAGAVIAPADHRQNSAGAWLDRDQGAFETLARSAAVQMRMELLQLFKIGDHRVAPGLFQFGVQGSVYAQSGEHAVDRGKLRNLRRHVISEVWRPAQPGRRHGDDRFSEGCLVAGLIKRTRPPHQTEHDVTSLARGIGMPPRVIAARGLNHTNERGRLCRAHLAQVLVEEVARGERHSIDRRALIFPHPDIVDIALEDFVLDRRISSTSAIASSRNLR